MALGVLNNISAVYAENDLNQTQASLQTTLQQLSSGSRINSGADDAAGLSIADGLAANSAALTQSSSNATAGVGFLQVADGALSQVTNLLNRAVTLATEAAGGTLSTSQLGAAQQEYGDILTQIGTIGGTTEYNGIQVFTSGTGSATALSFNTPGAGAALTTTITQGDTLSGSIGISSTAGTDAGSTVIELSQYAGLSSDDQSTENDAAAALQSALDSGLGSQTKGTYTVTDTAGALSITPSVGTEKLAVTASNATQAPANGTAVNIYTGDGSTNGHASYAVTVGDLSDSTVGTTAGGSGENLSSTDLNSQSDAESALTMITTAISDVAYQRGQVGANINTLTAASNIESAQETNVESAENNITQTDYAAATSNLSKYEILTQTGISALAQANSTEQMVTKLLQ